ncbi:hypothetical protein BC332_29784 [Capsicum chinense]|nr:hypothetical protein BC332_29784 [Capsicum chinense]
MRYKVKDRIERKPKGKRKREEETQEKQLSCPSCMHSRKGCSENCFMKKHFPEKDDYDAVGQVFCGPEHIKKLLKKCTNTKEAARCMIQEGRARMNDVEGGSWRLVENLRQQLEEIHNMPKPFVFLVVGVTNTNKIALIHVS